MKQKYLMIVGLAGILAVALGAFGAHALKPLLGAGQQAVFNTAVQYHFIHLLAMLGVLSLYFRKNIPLLIASYWLFLTGILLFSGSLYLLACKELLNLQGFAKILGPLTPLGGLSFIAGWTGLLFAARRMDDKNSKSYE